MFSLLISDGPVLYIYHYYFFVTKLLLVTCNPFLHTSFLKLYADYVYGLYVLMV